jgi:hypothetical protein
MLLSKNTNAGMVIFDDSERAVQAFKAMGRGWTVCHVR